MSRPPIPDEILELAHARQRAREAKDWPEADRLRAEIEAGGWKVVDQATSFRLRPAHPPNVVDGDRISYGSSGSVPSRLEEPPTALATLIVLLEGQTNDVAGYLGALGTSAPAGTQVVIVANAPSEAEESLLADPTGPASMPIGGAKPEIVWTSARLGHAAALNAGIRRAAGGVVVLLDTRVEPAGDPVSPLVHALADPSVAVVGARGIRSDDMRRFVDAAPGDVDAITEHCMAFRRRDYLERGPLDERFRVRAGLDMWWSLVLRDEGEGSRPRRAIAVAGLPARRHDERGGEAAESDLPFDMPPAERDRLARRNSYRILDRFGRRRDLLTTG